MSRSYKKTPGGGDSKGKDNKRLANHKVRQALKKNLELPRKGTKHKRVYNSWEICDYFDISTFEEYWNYRLKIWYNWGHLYDDSYPDKEKEYQNWCKYYRRK